GSARSSPSHGKYDVNSSKGDHTDYEKSNKHHALDKRKGYMREGADAVGSIHFGCVIDLPGNTLYSGKSEDGHKGDPHPSIGYYTS
ncbi:unnamed protein product, partial [marine sediment metagenome]